MTNKKKLYYFILCGEKELKDKLDEAGFYTDENCILRVGFYSKVGKYLRDVIKKQKTGEKE